ncbi:MAG: response regulator [Candidatus Dadabacteria bacterium]|nr:MAG: response regulator [Candidatus Dadabacteria bacterium]
MIKDILIVEDTVEQRRRLEKLLSEKGYAVQACASAKEGEEAVLDNSFKLAILDIGLGDKSGSYLFHHLKTSKKVEQILIYTGNPSVHLKQRFLSEGASAYIVKGSKDASDEALLTLIEDLIGLADSESQTTSAKEQKLPLLHFIKMYLTEESAALFLEKDGSFPPCSNCGGKDYYLDFTKEPQVPPTITGVVVCSQCGCELDPHIG